MICGRCGTVFCWDDADTVLLGNSPKEFCSEKCRKRAKVKRRRKKVPGRRWRARSARERYCRAKRRYASEAAALAGMSRINAEIAATGSERRLTGAYCCEFHDCWHLTSEARPGVPETAGTRSDQALWVATLKTTGHRGCNPS